MGQQDIIDIERLREAVDYFEQEWQLNGHPSLWDARKAIDLRPVAFDAMNFLVSLADQGGELWMEKPCDRPSCVVGFESGGLPLGMECKQCGGSEVVRVRVWPKE